MADDAQEPSLFPAGNGQLQRVKREGGNFLSKAKTIGLTVGALLLASVTFGIDMAVTTILTPLVIITLTKNIDLKQIIGWLIGMALAWGSASRLMDFDNGIYKRGGPKNQESSLNI